MITCRHCGNLRRPKCRGLCLVCYYRPGVREQYLSTSKFARRGIRDYNGASDLPAEPTSASAGSLEKVAVLEARAGLKLALWHPDDSIVLDKATSASGHGNLRIGRHKRKRHA